eukprot:TRINITY_DN8893_c0_g1_i1.p1 TRINITY_DN8893_c0_g1~~TRINITY_DN8893_c0_g1_i1.p1  ORF type:complete len:288 (+),score=61.34 TRINITY_DN8893_c0_g1_i1:55-918(+)
MDEIASNIESNEKNIVVNVLSSPELFATVVKYLGIEEMFLVCISCKRWSSMLTNSNCWKTICREREDSNLDCRHFHPPRENNLRNRFLIHKSMKWGAHSKYYEISGDGLTVKKIEYFDQNQNNVRGNVGLVSGKHYWEIHVDSFEEGQPYFLTGIVPSDAPLDGHWLGWRGFGYCYTSLGTYIVESFGYPYHKGGYRSGDVIGVYVDLDTSSLKFFQNGEDLGWVITNFRKKASVKWTDPVYPAVATPSKGDKFTGNFHANVPRMNQESPKDHVSLPKDKEKERPDA